MLAAPKPETHLPVLIGGEAGEVLVRERGKRIPFSEDTANHLCTLYAEGWSLTELCGLECFPSRQTFQRWLSTQTAFREQFEGARRMRALIAEESAEAVLDESPGTMAEVTWAGKRFDANIKLAEVRDPQRYGKKVTVGGDADRPIVFKLVTGVPAPRAPHIELNADGTIRKPDIEVTPSPGSSEVRALVPAERPEAAGSTPAPGTLAETPL